MLVSVLLGMVSVGVGEGIGDAIIVVVDNCCWLTVVKQAAVV